MNWLNFLKQYFQQSWKSLTQDWQMLREDPIPTSELNETFFKASLPTFNFYLLQASAAAIRVRVDGWDYPPHLSVRSEHEVG